MKKFFFAVAIAVFALPAFADQIVGVGIALEKSHSDFLVREVLAGTPAFRAGIQVGEHIFAVDGVVTKGKKLDEVVASIRGTEGTKVSLTLGSDSAHARTLELVRAVIQYQNQCFLEGNVNLMTNGSWPTMPPTFVSGYVGSHYVTGSIVVAGGSTYGQGIVYLNVNGQTFTLTYMNNGSQATIQGYIRGASVYWYGNGNSFFGYQNCIP